MKQILTVFGSVDRKLQNYECGRRLVLFRFHADSLCGVCYALSDDETVACCRNDIVVGIVVTILYIKQLTI